MRIYLGGFLDFYAPQNTRWMEVELEQPVLLRVLLQELGIPASEIYLIVINGELVSLEQARVVNDDEVKVFPPVGGG